MLLADIEQEQQDLERQRAVYEQALRAERIRSARLPPRPLDNPMARLSEAIDMIDKVSRMKKRVVYDENGRPIGTEPITDE